MSDPPDDPKEEMAESLEQHLKARREAAHERLASLFTETPDKEDHDADDPA